MILSRLTLRQLFSAWLCLWALGLAPAWAGVQDGGGFFSAAARSEAARKISEIDHTFRKQVEIETFATVPPDVQKKLNLVESSNAARVYQEWSVQQARSKGVNGIYVLLVKSPAHLQAVVGNDTARRAFTQQDRDALVSLMLSKLRQKDYDGALLGGVDFIASTMRSHAGSGEAGTGSAVRHEARASAGSESGWIIPLLIAGVVVWAILGIVKALFRGRSGGLSSPMAPQAGGGGFLSSLLGGMLGAGTGMWLYNNFFGGNSAMGAGPQDHLNSGDQGFSGQDTDYSSSGGDFNDSGSSGGGGDWGGGGDSGGGGGDSGGGGGGDF